MSKAVHRSVSFTGNKNFEEFEVPRFKNSYLELNASSEVPTPNRSERITQFGVECIDKVHFLHWEPGGEYVKHIVVKNVLFKTQKITYKLPKSKFFSMEFPEITTLSTGMSCTIPITFRPVAKEPYFDVIEFSTSMGQFNFPVMATLAKHDIQFEESIDFRNCPVMETAQRIVMFRNSGELVTYFNWFVMEPFSISPMMGTLKPGEEIKVTVNFNPKNASVFEAKGICSFGDNIQILSDKKFTTSGGAGNMSASPGSTEDLENKTLHIKGVGKYSFLTVKSSERALNKDNDSVKIEFGNIHVGKTATVHFDLVNLSHVLSRFVVRRVKEEMMLPSNFQFSLIQGQVEPDGGKASMSVTFVPVTPEAYSMEYYEIFTISGNTLRFALCGKAIGPVVRLGTRLVNFGDVEVGTVSSRAMMITNESKCEAFYEFHLSKHGVFEMDKPYGTLAPESTIGINLKFKPRIPCHYYRRVYCLIEHQHPLVVEFIGTCYDDKRRPATFEPYHLRRYRHRLDSGLFPYPPEQLDEMIRLGTIKIDPEGLLSPANPRIFQQNVPACQPKNISEQYFAEQTIAFNPEVGLETQSIDFGSCSRFRVIEPLSIRVSNRTRGKMTCCWTVSPPTSANEVKVFTIQPDCADILPKSTAEFKVFFQPPLEDRFYGQYLEGYVYFKSMRSFRLVNDETFTPPWFISAYVAGNTFTKADSFIPKINFNTGNILEFPSCLVGNQVFRTVKVTNTGDTPVKYWLTLDHTANVFSAKPQSGSLAKNQSQLIMFRFAPVDERHYDYPMTCQFNTGSATYDMRIRGSGYFPKMEIDPVMLCIKPTCVKGVTKRTFCIKNLTKIFVGYKWNIPNQLQSIVSIVPRKGILRPNAIQTVECFFAPQQVRSYVLKLSCYFQEFDSEFDGELDSIIQRGNKVTLSLMGQGIEGVITCNEPVIDFGSVLVNHSHSRGITLYNPSDCDLLYRLSVSTLPQSPSEIEAAAEREADEEDLKPMVPADLEGLFSFEPDRNVIPARSKINIKIKTTLSEQRLYKVQLNYILIQQQLPKDQRSIAPVESYLSELIGSNEERKLSEIHAKGVFPLLQVSYISGPGLTTNLLWSLFNIDQFNELLCFDARKDLIDHKTLPSVEFNMFASMLGSAPLVVNFEFANQGVVDIEWSLIFPNDLEVHSMIGNGSGGSGSIGGSASTGEEGGGSNQQQSLKLGEEHVANGTLALEHRLFQVFPRNGSLAPSERVAIQITYFPRIPGSHSLPLILKIQNGPPSWFGSRLINLTATTYAPKETFIPFASRLWKMASVHVGMKSPPIQSYSLYNRSSEPIRYSVDMQVLAQVAQDNFQYQVLNCLNPEGVIEPFSIHQVEWIFAPVLYGPFEVEIPFLINGKTSVLIKFQGFGLEKKVDLNEVDQDLIPNVQSMKLPNQIASLSQERFNLGCMPISSRKSVLVAVNNDSEDDIQFEWKIWTSVAKVKVSPSYGSIRRGSCQLCRVTFEALIDPRMINVYIECHVHTKTALNCYNHALQVLEKMVREKQNALLQDKRRLSNEELDTISTKSFGRIPEDEENSGNDEEIDGENGEDEEREQVTVEVQRERPVDSAAAASFSKYRTPLPPIPNNPVLWGPNPAASGGRKYKSSGAYASRAGGLDANNIDSTTEGNGNNQDESNIPSYMKTRSARKNKNQVVVDGYVLTAESKPPTPPDPTILFVNMRARVLSRQEFGEIYPSQRRFYFNPISNNNKSSPVIEMKPQGDSHFIETFQTLGTITNGSHSVQHSISNILFDLLEDVMNDLENENITESLVAEVPSFLNLRSRSFILQEDNLTGRKRSNIQKLQHGNSVQTQRKALWKSIVPGTELAFASLAENVLENTIFNILQEACYELYEFTSLSSLKVLSKEECLENHGQQDC